MIDKMLAFVDIVVKNSNKVNKFDDSNINLKMISDYKSMGSRDAKLNFFSNINVNKLNRKILITKMVKKQTLPKHKNINKN